MAAELLGDKPIRTTTRSFGNPGTRGRPYTYKPPTTAPTTVTFHAVQPSWVPRDLHPGEVYHVVGSGRFCQRDKYDTKEPYVVFEFDNSGYRS